MNRETLYIDNLDIIDEEGELVQLEEILNPYIWNNTLEYSEKHTGFKFIEEQYNPSGISYGVVTVIVQRLSDLKFFKGFYTRIEHNGYSYDNRELIEVFPDSKMTTIYK